MEERLRTEANKEVRVKEKNTGEIEKAKSDDDGIVRDSYGFAYTVKDWEIID